MNIEDCLCKSIPQEVLEQIIKIMPEVSVMENMSMFFKNFGDPTRLRIIHILMHQELCVADLASLLQMNQPAVSQHLKVLRLSRLVKYRKEGKTIYYALNDHHVSEIYKIAQQHIEEGG